MADRTRASIVSFLYKETIENYSGKVVEQA